MKKIVFVTGSRADYGLLKNLIFSFQEDKSFEVHTIATGSHLSVLHGKTVDILKADKIQNLVEVDLDIVGDQPQNICDAIATGTSKFVGTYQKIKPELIIVLGDRYELWAACIPAAILNIPVAHIHGGESTEGLIDEAIRHSVTKMSHLHFCSHPLYQKRIISMGENPKNVHLVGAVGLDRIKQMSFLSREEIEAKLSFKFSAKNILCTFHPVTLDEKESNAEIDQLVESLDTVLRDPEISIFITLPNADTFSSYIRTSWEKFILKNGSRVYGFSNLGDLLYLSLMKNVDLVLGNSSSGIIEAPFLNKAIIDIGNRQKGRLKSGHILSSDGSKVDLVSKIKMSLSENFQSKVKKEASIYGEGESCKKIYTVIKNLDIDKLKFKHFFDGDSI